MKKIKLISSITVCVLLIVLTESVFNKASAAVYIDTNNHWSRTYVDKMTELGIMEPASTYYFNPNAQVKRKDAAKSLCMLIRKNNLESSPHPFTDVPYNDSYSKYVKYLSDRGIMNGTDSTTFSPDLSIKRQDMCVILYNLYFNSVGVPVRNKYASITTFSDDSQISAYAKDKVYKLQQIGVVGGDGGAFRPKDFLTKGEAAALLYRLWEYGLVLITPQQQQQQSQWCWNACAKIMAEYKYPGSRTQQEIANHFVGGRNEAASIAITAEAATYATYNNYNHTSSGTLSHNNLMLKVGDFHPTAVCHANYYNGNRTNGHAMVCIGYVRVTSNLENSLIFIYDVWNNTYHWFTYNEFLYGNDNDGYLDLKQYDGTAYGI